LYQFENWYQIDTIENANFCYEKHEILFALFSEIIYVGNFSDLSIISLCHR